MQLAARNGHFVIVKLLLEAGADVEARDRWGQTALHWAAKRSQANEVKLLLEAGADAEARTTAGQTPRDLATRHAVIRVLDQATGKETP